MLRQLPSKERIVTGRSCVCLAQVVRKPRVRMTAKPFKMRAAYVQASSEVISEICFTIDSEIDRLGSFGRVNHFVDSITYFAGGGVE